MTLELLAVRIPFIVQGRVYWAGRKSVSVKVYEKKPLVIAVTSLYRIESDSVRLSSPVPSLAGGRLSVEISESEITPPSASVPPDLGVEVE